MMFSQLYEVSSRHVDCLPVWCLFYLYDFFLPILRQLNCLLNSMMSARLYDVCSTIWRLSTCMMSAVLYDRRLPVGLFLPVWCLLDCMMSAYLYDVVLPVWCLYSCAVSAHWNDVCSTIWCLPTCIISSYLCDVFTTRICLSTYIYVSLPVWVCSIVPQKSFIFVLWRSNARLLGTCTIYKTGINALKNCKNYFFALLLRSWAN